MTNINNEEERRGRPPYDPLSIFFAVQTAKRLSKLNLSEACRRSLIVIRNGLPPDLPPSRFYEPKEYITLRGETLRRRFYDARHKVLDDFSDLPAAVESSDAWDEIQRLVQEAIDLQSMTPEDFFAKPRTGVISAHA